MKSLAVKIVVGKFGRLPSRKESGSAVTNAVTHGGTITSVKSSEKPSTISLVPNAAKSFTSMAINVGNIAAMIATLPLVSKAVQTMSKEDMRREKLYQTTMHITRKMLKDGIISEEEYRRVDKIFLEKYKPIFGTLFSDTR